MKIHMQKQNQPRQQLSPNIKKPSARPLAAGHAVHPIMQLQRTIGNQAVLRLLPANVEGLGLGSDTLATTRFAHNFSRIPQHSTAQKGVQPKLEINEPEEKHEPEANRVATRVMQLPGALGSSADLSPSIQRKCVACGDGPGVCPKCARGEGRLRRLLTTATNMTPAMQHKTEIPEEQNRELEQMKEGLVKPDQTVILSEPKCGSEYGAKAKLSYAGALGWWFKERIKVVSNTCSKAGKTTVDATTSPIQNSSDADYFYDFITNSNGPPSKRAPCKTITQQTIFTGPTKAKVEKYRYDNTQTIDVTVDKVKSPKSGQVITSVETETGSIKPALCNWTA